MSRGLVTPLPRSRASRGGGGGGGGAQAGMVAPREGAWMKPLASLAVLVALGAAPLRAEEPFPIAYYYKVRWGFQQEFERLFFKYHYPLLVAQKERGRMLGVNVYRPNFHGEGRGGGGGRC